MIFKMLQEKIEWLDQFYKDDGLYVDTTDCLELSKIENLSAQKWTWNQCWY